MFEYEALSQLDRSPCGSIIMIGPTVRWAIIRQRQPIRARRSLESEFGVGAGGLSTSEAEKLLLDILDKDRRFPMNAADGSGDLEFIWGVVRKA